MFKLGADQLSGGRCGKTSTTQTMCAGAGGSRVRSGIAPALAHAGVSALLRAILLPLQRRPRSSYQRSQLHVENSACRGHQHIEGLRRFRCGQGDFSGNDKRAQSRSAASRLDDRLRRQSLHREYQTKASTGNCRIVGGRFVFSRRDAAQPAYTCLCNVALPGPVKRWNANRRNLSPPIQSGSQSNSAPARLEGYPIRLA